jgi:hypothetical protein
MGSMILLPYLPGWLRTADAQDVTDLARYDYVNTRVRYDPVCQQDGI